MAKADFLSSVGFSGGTATFTSTFAPTSTTVIVATSDGYLMAAPGLTPVIVTLTYEADAMYGWDMAFSPIVIP